MRAAAEGGRLERLLAIGPLVKDRYLHWDEVRHRPPPDQISTEEWWAGLKLARMKLSKELPLLDSKGQRFRYGTPDSVLELLHFVDRQASGGIQIAEEVTNPATRDRYIISSLMQESITSSQLEGAATTTEVAKDMLRSGRPPQSRDEQMIVNNYRAMRFIQESRERELTPAFVLELHEIVTRDTLDDPTKAGHLRSADDRIQIEDETGTVLHVPPAARELPERLTTLCDFANGSGGEGFLHPVVRAVILHFGLAYDHPFVDGNGRTARALFYWSMLSQDYWLAEFVSISRILNQAPAKYARSFLYAETDDNDVTYFLEYQLHVLRRAIEDLQGYLERKVSEVREVEALLRRSADLNHRQLALLGRSLRHPGQQYTIESHRRSHDVAYQTARTDLLDLVERGLLVQWKRGRRFVFTAGSDLAERLRDGRSASENRR